MSPRTTEDAEKQNQEFIRIATEKEGIHEKLRGIRQEQEVMAHGCARVKALYDLIDEKASGIREYDDNLAARIIRQVTVQSKEQISVKFNEIGIELEMSLNG